MGNASPRSWQFSLRDLFVAITCLGILGALLVPALHASMEASRRNHCQNNLKQMGLGVHNFHDTYLGLPPLSVGEGRGGLFSLIRVFADQWNGSDIESDIPGPGELFDGPAWARLPAAAKDRLNSVDFYHCPNRRNGNSRVAAEDAVYFGPTGDYAVVFLDGDIDYGAAGAPQGELTPAEPWEDHYDPCDDIQVSRQRGVIRLADVNCDSYPLAYQLWKPRDTFARVTDGTANTLLIGEKHLRSSERNRYAADPERQDGTWLFEARGWRMFNVARNMRFPLANGMNDPRFAPGKGKGPHADFGFGSAHPGAIPFVRADGSVTYISPSIEPLVAHKYAHAQDGITGCCDF